MGDHCGNGRMNGLIQSFHISHPPQEQKHVKTGSQSEATWDQTLQTEIRRSRTCHSVWRKTMDAAFTGAGVAAFSHKVQHVRPPPAVTCITEVVGTQHAGQDKSTSVDHTREFFEQQTVIRNVVENREVRRDGLHLACEGACDRGDAVACDFIATIPHQIIVHCLRGFIHESLVSAGGIKLGINTGARTEIEHVRSCRHQTQRRFLKQIAHSPISSRGQDEFVILLSSMHPVGCCDGSSPCSCTAYRYCPFWKIRLHARTSDTPTGVPIPPQRYRPGAENPSLESSRFVAMSELAFIRPNSVPATVSAWCDPSSRHLCRFSPKCRRLRMKVFASHGVPARSAFLRARAPSAPTPPQSLRTVAVHPQTTPRNPEAGVGPRHTASASSGALRRPWRTHGSSKAPAPPAVPDAERSSATKWTRLPERARRPSRKRLRQSSRPPDIRQDRP